MKIVNTAASVMLALALSLTAAFCIAAAASNNGSPSLMSRADYLSESRAVAGNTRLALAACRAGTDTERSVCRAKAQADDRVARATLDARYRGTIEARERVRAVEARAAHSVSEARRLASPT
jgi:hypothetical protein